MSGNAYDYTSHGINWLGARGKFIAAISGAQPADLVVPITRSKTATYDTSGATDGGADASRYYTEYIIQPSTTNAKDVTVQLSVDGVTWNDCPTELLSPAASATIAAGTGTVLYMILPCPGAQVRLLVAQPVAGTDFTVSVMMSNTHSRYDPKRR